ncbi:MAG: hypothetical protein JNK09_17700 [Prolixibacteraceae bacterium]|nr:hypothetical protein [Prolixibacteraceae bacterium]
MIVLPDFGYHLDIGHWLFNIGYFFVFVIPSEIRFSIFLSPNRGRVLLYLSPSQGDTPFALGYYKSSLQD